ncbi:hypothetical protein BGX38DRAFT_503275 [Terfezia claveryi]|nr:hypothetical protein BGX38DRAFT_503275 [Terfezia claveryi]
MCAQKSEGSSVGSASGGIDGDGNGVVNVEEDGERERDGKKESSDEEPRIRIREPRPEELQEPRVIFVDSELFIPPRRRRRYTSPDMFEQALNSASPNLLLPRGRYRHSRKYAPRVDRISRLPNEILHEIIEYVGLQRLYDDPQNEGTVYERSRAESIRAVDLRPLRFINRKFYLVVQTIIYTRINITAIPDFERLARQLHMRERLASMVLDVTVDIHQLRKTENWRDYGKPRAIAKSREAGQKMTLGTAHLIRDISSIFENCKFLSRFAFHCTGAVQAFCRLEGNYPSVRKVSVCDQLEIGKTGDTFWRSIQRFPNIEEVSLLRSEENRDLDFRPIQINPVGKAWAFSNYDNLQFLKFTNAAEISDKLLLYILPNLPKLSRIYLYECKLVTASGIARVVTQIQDRLTEFVYCDYVDCNGKTSPDEEKTKKSCHLCHALARCPNLRDLSLSAYRCCSDLFTMSNWPYLRNLKIDMMFYTGCNDEEEDTDLREALVQACVEGRLPSLTSSSILFQTSKILLPLDIDIALKAD